MTSKCWARYSRSYGNRAFTLAELMDLTQIHHPDWFYMIVMSRCYVIDKYIKSLCLGAGKGYVRSADRLPAACDKDTGEVLREQ